MTVEESKREAPSGLHQMDRETELMCIKETISALQERIAVLEERQHTLRRHMRVAGAE